MTDSPQQLLGLSTSQSPLLSEEAGDKPDKTYCVILASGEQPTHDIPVRLLQEAPYLVCCDGAIRHSDRADAVVGDGDSIPSWARNEYEGIFHQEDEQADNDLTKATRFCIGKGFRRMVYLGATGLREDHTMGNISLLMRYAGEMSLEPLMATNYGWFVPVTGKKLRTTRFSSFPGQQVSLFNFGCTRLRTSGLRYDGYPFRSWWQGTLNEATAETFSVEADGDYLVYRTYEAKK